MIFPPSLVRLVTAPLSVTQHWVAAWQGYGASAPSPLRWVSDGAAFWLAISATQEPRFAHPNTVVAQWPLAQLRDFSTARPQAAQPTLVLPARSGMTSAGVDLSLDASLVGTLLANGHDRTHSLDWYPANSGTATASIADHVEVVRAAIALLGGRVHLVGYSQGGWLAAIVAALDPESVVGLTLGAAPIDTHAGVDVPMKIGYRALGLVGGLTSKADSYGWIHPGFLQSGLLRAREWDVEGKRAAQLWGGIQDPDRVRRHTAVRRWLNTPEDLPGPFVRWSVEELFGANKLILGELEVGGQLVDLSRIQCPLYLIAGESDDICPPVQVWAIIDVVSTPVEDIHRVSAPVGHLDLLFDPKILDGYWAPLVAASAGSA